MTDFGARLKEAMQKKRITAAELSRESGVGKNMISYYLSGKCLAKQDKVYHLSKALDVDPGWLMTGVEPEEREEFSFPTFFSDSKRALEFIKAMPIEDYKTFIDILRRAEQKLKEQEEHT